jgi:hypothetical protein
MRTMTWQAVTNMQIAGLLLLPLLLLGVASADDADPSGRVARLGYTQGQVSIEPAGLSDWAAAGLNRPITTGDKIWSDADSRVELSIGSAVVRLGSSTGFSFLNLDDQTAQMQVTAGTASVHVRSMAQNETLEIDTPNTAVSLLGPGDYRVEVNDAGDTTVVKVSGGTAEVTGGGQDFPVHPQQSATFTGTTDVSEDVASLGAPDAFDDWTFARDRRQQSAQAWNHVSPDVIGAEDLDPNGSWQSTPDDGYVWAPNSVAPGWAPYQSGQWLWTSPWGWTWVDNASWGFAPFHYGRWGTFGGRWCWVPGPQRLRPVYAPALVAWVGGAQMRTALAFGGGGGVGWFPLGPGEVYVPAYSVSPSYVRNVNVANTRVNDSYITQVYTNGVPNIRYVNRNVPGAITVVSQTNFTSAQSVGRNAVRLPANELAAASTSSRAPAIIPEEQSVLGAGTVGESVHRPPVAIQNRRVLARTAPPPAPVPFLLQQEAIRAHGGRPLARSEVAALQVLAPRAQARLIASARSAESRTGMSRAARPNLPIAPRPVAPTPEPQPRAAFSRPAAPPPAPAVVSGPIDRTLPPDSTIRPSIRLDRPPPAAVQPGIDIRPNTNNVRPPVEVRSTPVEPNSNRRVDRQEAEARPIPEAAPLPVLRTAKPAPHAERPAHPAEHSKVNN